MFDISKTKIIQSINNQTDYETQQMLNEHLLYEITSVAALVGSVSLAILGITSAIAGATFATPLILISIPALYLAYNNYQLSQNIKRIIENPRLITPLFSPNTIDKEKFRAVMLENTFHFEWFVDWMKTRLC